jgi:hypothetical protein
MVSTLVLYSVSPEFEVSRVGVTVRNEAISVRRCGTILLQYPEQRHCHAIILHYVIWVNDRPS